MPSSLTEKVFSELESPKAEDMFLYFVLSHYYTQQDKNPETEMHNSALRKKAREAFHSLGERTVPFLLGHFDEVKSRSMHGTNVVWDLTALAKENQLGRNKEAVLEKSKEILLAPYSAWSSIWVQNLYEAVSAPDTKEIVPELKKEILTPSDTGPLATVGPNVHGKHMEVLMRISPEDGKALLSEVIENNEYDLADRVAAFRRLFEDNEKEPDVTTTLSLLEEAAANALANNAPDRKQQVSNLSALENIVQFVSMREKIAQEARPVLKSIKSRVEKILNESESEEQALP